MILQELIEFIKTNPEFTAGAVVAITMGYKAYRRIRSDSDSDNLVNDQESFRKSLLEEISSLKESNEELGKEVIRLTEKLAKSDARYAGLLKNVTILKKILSTSINDENISKTVESFLTHETIDQS